MINFSELLWKGQTATDEPVRAVGSRETYRAATSVNDNVLSHVPVVEARLKPESRIAVLVDSKGAGADRFRFLRMRLREIQAMAKLSSLAITSSLPRDGKSTVALNLATALAEQGRRSVVLVDADLHRPSLADSLGIPRRPGLAECLEGELDPISALQRVEPLALYLLDSGDAQKNPTELLQTDALVTIVQKLSSQFEWIIFDTPPVAPLTDAISLSRAVDASLLVVRAGSTPKQAVEEAVERLGKKHVLGVVFNGSEGLNRAYSKYYGRYDGRD
jgi:capsular exopolysaccharide synthesis family protein